MLELQKTLNCVQSKLWENAIIFFIGIVSVVCCVLSTLYQSGYSVLFYGAFIFGGIRFFKCLYYYVRLKADYVKTKKYIDNLKLCADQIAHLWGFVDFVALEYAAETKHGYKIPDSSDPLIRFDNFAHFYQKKDFREFYLDIIEKCNLSSDNTQEAITG